MRRFAAASGFAEWAKTHSGERRDPTRANLE